jgi:2-C-methyl-D-erythritol 4-phosphate cytidylyltransferase
VKSATVIIVAAGRGERFGGNKPFAMLGGKPIIDWSLETFETHADVGAVILVLPPGRNGDDFRRRYPKIHAVVPGGKERQDSVLRGFGWAAAERGEVVLIHDGARPFASADLVGRIIRAAASGGAAIPVLPASDTIKRVRDGCVVETLDRSELAAVQTPQGFSRGVLAAALDKAVREGYVGTDEAALVERAGYPVHVVPGEPGNIKITRPEDLKLAEALLHV